jgi:hypothetical protein
MTGWSAEVLAALAELERHLRTGIVQQREMIAWLGRLVEQNRELQDGIASALDQALALAAADNDLRRELLAAVDRDLARALADAPTAWTPGPTETLARPALDGEPHVFGSRPQPGGRKVIN